MKKLKKLTIIALVLVVGAGVGLYFLSSSLIKAAVETGGTAALETDVQVDAASLSAFTGTASLDGLAIQNLEGFEQPHLLTAKGIQIEVSPFSLLSSPVVIGAIVIDEPVFVLEAALTSTNLTKLLSRLQKKTSEPGATESEPATESSKSSKPTELEIEVVRIVKPKFVVAQSAVGSDNDELVLDTIEIKDWEKTTIAGLTSRILGEVLEAAAKKNKIPAELIALMKSDLLDVEGLGGILEGLDSVGGGVKEAVDGASKILKGLIPGGK